jgi:glycine cleavage system regulatory protein
MNTFLVLTILGPDRPGLVESIARLVAEHGGNWIESRMAHLAGQFAGILRVEVPADRAEALSAAIRELSAAGLESVVHADRTPTPVTTDAEKAPTIHLDLVGQDRPGIVREISRVLSSHGVNVEELNTACMSAALSGQSLFKCTADLRLPPGLATERLRSALEAVAADLMVDLTLR